MIKVLKSKTAFISTHLTKFMVKLVSSVNKVVESDFSFELFDKLWIAIFLCDLLSVIALLLLIHTLRR